MASPGTLLEWERAEILRSSVQAERTLRNVARTSPRILARYANPPHDTVYALEYALHLLGDVSGQRVLDLGCGDGQFTTLVASHGATIVGLDISLDLLAIARSRLNADGYDERVSELCGSAHAIPLPDASVDVVFGMAILHHLDLSLTAREVHRVLRPGGRAIFKEPMRDSRVLAALRALIPYRHPDVSPYERPLRQSEVDAFRSHFRSWRFRTFELPFVALLRICHARRSVEGAACRRSDRLIQRFPRLGRYASYIVFEVRK
jgi:SAM-dependent methyltransferase